MGNIRVRLAPGIYGRILRSISMRTQAAASSRVTMPRVAVNRKDTGWRIDWHPRLDGYQGRLKTLPVWRYRGRGPHARGAAHAIVVTSPRNWVRRRPPVEPR